MNYAIKVVGTDGYQGMHDAPSFAIAAEIMLMYITFACYGRDPSKLISVTVDDEKEVGNAQIGCLCGCNSKRSYQIVYTGRSSRITPSAN